ncbi:flagellar protein FlhE [Salmonella enterica subsp. enterica serovar Virchow str. ATCC 51955]|nr:flagellar protein FlhE [Salmonella enterica subsp. enterica serovar Virchow str. ATCC 51955]
MRKWLALLLFPLTVQAAGEGAWQDSGMGVTLNYRGVSASSSPLSARQPVSGVMTLVAWRYELNGPTPASLRVRLCSQSRCVELDGQSGTTHGFCSCSRSRAAPLCLGSPRRRPTYPGVKVRSNQVIVNYR